MDYKKIRKTQIKMNNLNTRKQMLEELHKETLDKIIETQKVCNHDLIFIYGKYENMAYEYLQYGKCLVCGKGITLTPDNVTDTNEFIDEENIVDIVGDNIEVWNIDCDCSLKRSEIEEAEKVFCKLTNEANYSKDCIKSAIVDAVNEMKLYKKKK